MLAVRAAAVPGKEARKVAADRAGGVAQLERARRGALLERAQRQAPAMRTTPRVVTPTQPACMPIPWHAQAHAAVS